MVFMTESARATRAALLDLRGGFQLLEVLGGVLGQLVVVEVLVAAVAGELLTGRLRLLDHLFHHLLRLRTPALDARLRGRRVALGRDGTFSVIADRAAPQGRDRQTYSLDYGSGTSIQERLPTVVAFRSQPKPDIVTHHATDPREERARRT